MLGIQTVDISFFGMDLVGLYLVDLHGAVVENCGQDTERMGNLNIHHVMRTGSILNKKTLLQCNQLKASLSQNKMTSQVKVRMTCLADRDVKKTWRDCYYKKIRTEKIVE